MNANSRQQKRILRESLAAALVLALLASALGAKGRQGAEVVITMTDGKTLGGELLAVKGLTVVLLDTTTAAESIYELADIQALVVSRKSHWLPGMIIGAVIGGVAGTLSGKSSGSTDPNDDRMSKGQMAAAGAVLYGLCGAGVGAMIRDRKFKVQRTDADYLADLAAKLKGYARNAN